MKPPPPNPQKEQIAKHLRIADALARKKRYEEAMAEIDKALEIDPKNYYARSFKDRIQQTVNQSDKVFATDISEGDKKVALIAQFLKVAEEFIEKKEYKKALEQVARVYRIDSQNYYAQAYSERIEILMAQEGTPQPAPVLPETPPETPPAPAPITAATIEMPKESEARLDMYRKLLKEMWFDGKLDEAEAAELKKIRDQFDISQEYHEEIEKQVHVDAYVEALTIAWKDGILSQNEKEVLGVMRQRFNISLEEHLSAEAKILWARNNEKGKAQVLIVDDEKTTLLSLTSKLKKHGYDVLAADSVEQALEILTLSTPAIILSDLMFGPGRLGGLEFYQKVRENKRLEETPFLLMSGFSDEYVVRAGMRMGVDSFFQKPFSLELLLATIEGKLERKKK